MIAITQNEQLRVVLVVGVAADAAGAVVAAIALTAAGAVSSAVDAGAANDVACFFAHLHASVFVCLLVCCHACFLVSDPGGIRIWIWLWDDSPQQPTSTKFLQ